MNLARVRSIAASLWGECRPRWRALLGAGIALRVASVLLLGPLYAAVLRLAIAGSGKRVLTDQDLLYFVTSPIGVAGLVVVSALAVAIAALELGVYLSVLSQPPEATSSLAALKFTLRRAVRIARVAVRVIVQTLLWLAPALVVAGVTYVALLSKFDINYYLSGRPASFWGAAVIAAGLAVYLGVVALKLASDWFLALPIAMFEEEDHRRVGGLSRQRTADQRWAIRGWLLAWAAGSMLASTMTTLLIGAAAWLIAPLWPTSLAATAVGVGLSLAAVIVASVAVNLVSVVALAALLRRLYQRYGGAQPSPLGGDARDALSWITKRRLKIGALLAPLIAATAGFVAIASMPIEDNVAVIGHRGSPRSAPGNTLASVRAAIAEGVDWVEIDVQESADGEVVVFHDSDFMKAAGVDLKIWDATADRLAKIDIGSPFGPEFAGERVPTLAQVLDQCRDKAGVLVELKYYGHDVRLEERVVEIVENAGMAEQTMFMSLNREGVAKLKALRPEWRVGQLLSVAAGSASRIEADFLGVNASFANRGLIRAAHRGGHDLYVWTVDDPLTMSSLISRGVDGVITNVPTVARAVLAERAELTPVSRLLIDLADRFRLASPLRPPTTPEAP